MNGSFFKFRERVPMCKGSQWLAVFHDVRALGRDLNPQDLPAPYLFCRKMDPKEHGMGQRSQLLTHQIDE